MTVWTGYKRKPSKRRKPAQKLALFVPPRVALDKDDYERDVTLWVGVDGTLTSYPIEGSAISTNGGYAVNDWRGIAIDILVHGDITRAEDFIAQHRKEPLEIDYVDPEDAWQLPMFSVDTEAEARKIQVRFCRLMIGRHPCQRVTDRGWYCLSRFDGSIEDVHRSAEEMKAFWLSLKERT